MLYQYGSYLQKQKRCYYMTIFSLFLSVGENIKLLIDRPDGRYCFRLHRDRVYYMSEKLLKHATIVDKDKLMSIGTCFGKFTKTKKFHLHITALDYLAPYAQVYFLY